MTPETPTTDKPEPRGEQPPAADAAGPPAGTGATTGAGTAPTAGTGTEAGTGSGGGVAGRRPAVPALVLLITALHVALLVTYAFVYPTWTGYDEAQHVDMVYGLQHGAGWPAPGEKMIATGVAATSDDFDRGRYQDMFQSGGKRRGSPSFAEIAPTPRGERRSFDELGGPTPLDDGRLSNQMIQHPPLVYAVGAGLLEILPGSAGWAYDQQVLALRLLNILIVAPLPLLAWAAGRRFGLPGPLATAAAALPLAVPGFTRVGATFNNDGILVLATGALTVVLAGVVRGDLRRRTAAWAGLWFGVAMLSKAFAFALPVTIVAAYLVGWLRLRPRVQVTDDGSPAPTPAPAPAPAPRRPPALRRLPVPRGLPVLPATIAVGLGLVIGGWWWVRNFVLYDALQPNGWATNPPRREALLLPDSFLTWFGYFFRTMISRFWGGLGMFEPPQLSPVAIVAATVTVVGLVVTAVVTAARRGQPAAGEPGRIACLGAPLVLLTPAAFAYLMVGQRSWAEYERYTRGIAVQGRYLYLGLVGLAVVTAAGLGRVLGGRTRLAPLTVLAGAALMQGLALLAVCSYYWLPRGVALTPAQVPDIVSAAARWAPLPFGVTVAVFVLAALGWIAALTLAARAAAGGDRATTAAGGGRATTAAGGDRAAEAAGGDRAAEAEAGPAAGDPAAHLAGQETPTRS
ncbi:glycosyltransferase family 39 protein [Parafrankia elaeagni]|uniref:glycosyltransferase family 39 protein n=1 Tax=Parafrankia elaeagni TaxID=222534 RepID=UPI001E2D2933|nr:DUF2142 domain-containing protein [Parafrankia elaeagni]